MTIGQSQVNQSPTLPIHLRFAYGKLTGLLPTLRGITKSASLTDERIRVSVAMHIY